MIKIENLEERLSVPTIGRLMYDPIIPREKLDSVVEALMETGLPPSITLVEGYLRPQLQTEYERYIGAEAIIGFAKAYNPHINK